MLSVFICSSRGKLLRYIVEQYKLQRFTIMNSHKYRCKLPGEVIFNFKGLQCDFFVHGLTKRISPTLQQGILFPPEMSEKHHIKRVDVWLVQKVFFTALTKINHIVILRMRLVSTCMCTGKELGGANHENTHVAAYTILDTHAVDTHTGMTCCNDTVEAIAESLTLLSQ